MRKLTSLSTDERIEKFIETYQWLRTAAGERLLSRRNLHFTAVHPFADALTIVDISAPDFWNVRLSGTSACERLGSDTTGSNAQQSFSEAECALRIQLAYSLFHNPCGIRAKARETYSTGEQALLDTVALPLVGAKGEQLVVHYAQVIEDIHHAYRKRPAARRTNLMSFDYIDLGFGVPSESGYTDLKIA